MTRRALTTGANSGIGLATTVHLARLGFRTLGSVRSADAAAGLAKAAAEAGVDVEPLVIDLTDNAAWQEALADLDLYGLVNNAGSMNVGAMEDVDPAEALASWRPW